MKTSMAPGTTISLFLYLVFAVLACSSYGFQFKVGGRQGWVRNPYENYNHWAERMRFQVNDTLFFKYNKGSDNVLVVNRNGYNQCNTDHPIMKLDDGRSIFKFDRSGPFYFISGNKGNCQKGQKLIIVVLAVRNKKPQPPGVAPSVSPGHSPSAAPPHVLAPGNSPLAAPPTGLSPTSPSPVEKAPSPAPASSAKPPSSSPSPATRPSPTPAFSPPSPSPSTHSHGPSPSPVSHLAPAPAFSPQSPSPSIYSHGPSLAPSHAPGSAPMAHSPSPSATVLPPSPSSGGPTPAAGSPSISEAPTPGTPADSHSPTGAPKHSAAGQAFTPSAVLVSTVLLVLTAAFGGFFIY